MLQVDAQIILWANIAIQIAGFTSMVIARLAERSWARSFFQRFFFVCLFAVGVIPWWRSARPTVTGCLMEPHWA